MVKEFLGNSEIIFPEILDFLDDFLDLAQIWKFPMVYHHFPHILVAVNWD